MNEELANYLKEKKGLTRLFDQLKDKYISLGRYSGTVELKITTPQEATDISNFLGKTVKIDTEIQVSYKEIEKKLEQTKFKDFDWENLFYYYFGKKILSKKVKKQLAENSEELFFARLIDKSQRVQLKEDKYKEKVVELLKGDNLVHTNLKQRFSKNKEELASDLDRIFLLLENIPTSPLTLAVYASLTGNPHFLDFNTSTSNLFFKILSFILDKEEPKETFQKVKLLSEINVYTDVLSNYVITYHLNGSPLLREFYKRNQPLNLNLENLLAIKDIDTKKKRVFIFENPSMLTALKILEEGIVITSGIPNLSFYQLIDKLVETNHALYYNGDFDPEGLLIAQMIKKRYPTVVLFGYEAELYGEIKSKESINSSRLKKLENIDLTDLKEIKQCLLLEKLSAYQEKNIAWIKNYIEKM